MRGTFLLDIPWGPRYNTITKTGTPLTSPEKDKTMTNCFSSDFAAAITAARANTIFFAYEQDGAVEAFAFDGKGWTHLFHGVHTFPHTRRPRPITAAEVFRGVMEHEAEGSRRVTYSEPFARAFINRRDF